MHSQLLPIIGRYRVCLLEGVLSGGLSMPASKGSAKEEDPRVIELREINARLKTVIAYLKAKHTPRSIETSISDAEQRLGDHTPAFVTLEGATIEGTRHVGSLFRLCDALDVKAGMGGSGADALGECTALLERKIQLLRELHKV